MKLFKHIAAACATVVLLSSCSILNGTSSSDATSTGSNTGSALSALYKIILAGGTLDLSDLSTLINLGKILIGANSLTNASNSFVDQFTSGLISGSSNLVNSSNASAVVNGLKSLASIDTSVLATAAADAAAGKSFQVNSSTQGVSSTLSALNGIFNLLQ
jgi:hypothetical protein